MYFKDNKPDRENLLNEQQQEDGSTKTKKALFLKPDEELTGCKATGVIVLCALLPTFSAFVRNTFLILNVFYAAQLDTTTLQIVGVGQMIVGLLYISTGSAFLAGLGQIIERSS